MTVMVIGIALSLPTGLLLALDHVKNLSSHWQDSMQISVFFKPQVNYQEADEIVNLWQTKSTIKQIKLLSAEQALTEFKTASGLTDVLNILDKNPLPHTAIIIPQQTEDLKASLPVLFQELSSHSAVELAQLDMDWVERLNAMLDIAIQFSLMLAILLSTSVIFMVGNTIRLHIENQREEIEITKLIGATSAFVRRPFLYTGFWYGLLGGLIAWLIISLAVDFLAEPVNQLANLYQSSFYLHGLGENSLLLILFSCLLGISGAWITVVRFLSKIIPR
jgi:cell division transport system permease protein